MSETLFRIIKDHVFKTTEIREISRNGSGIEKPWIFDFKNQSLSPIFLKEYARCFWEKISMEFVGPIQIAGMEAGAIPLITGVSLLKPSEIEVNCFYVRKSRKKSDLANIIEGNVLPGKPIILIDDILNSGSTMKKLITVIENCGGKVAAIFVCIRYRDLSAYHDFIEKGIYVYSIFELNDFKNVLPVENKTSSVTPIPQDCYTIDYRLRLTKSPNFYLVNPKSGPVLADDHIYLGVDGGIFYAIDAESGKPAWTYSIPFGTLGKTIFSTPAIYKDNVLFGAYDGNFYCLDRATGKRRWVFLDADWIGSSPTVDPKNGIAFIGLEFGLLTKRGGLVAVNIASGNTKWKVYSIPGYVHASPAYFEKYDIVVVGSNDGHMYAFEASDGTLLWKYKCDGEIKYGATFDAQRDLVIFGTMNGGLYALQVKTGKLYHRFNAQFGFYATPAIHGDCVIIGSLDKRIYCFNLTTKEVSWIYETSGRVFASPLINGHSVFIGSNDGRLYELDTTTGTPLAIVQFTERIVNRIALKQLSDGRRVLYVGTHAGELYKLTERIPNIMRKNMGDNPVPETKYVIS